MHISGESHPLQMTRVGDSIAMSLRTDGKTCKLLDKYSTLHAGLLSRQIPYVHDFGQQGEEILADSQALLVHGYGWSDCILYTQVPYSLHCNYSELRNLVAALRPLQVIPTVTHGVEADVSVGLDQLFSDLTPNSASGTTSRDSGVAPPALLQR